MQQFDLVIAGGGVAGCSLALALAQQTQLKIAIVEKQPEAEYRIEQASATQADVSDARVVALAEQSWEFLKSLGVAESLRQIVTPIDHIHVSDRGHLGQCELSSSEYNVPALGYVCGLSPLLHKLEQELKASKVTWLRPDSVKTLQQKESHILIETEHEQLETKLLVVAEGGESDTRKKLGFVTQQKQYQQVALVTNIRANKPHHGTAYERFTQDGPLALLPLGERDYSVVWSLKTGEQEDLLSMPDADFLAELQQAFGYRAGIFEQCSQRQSFPLKLVTMPNTVGHRCALVGNAVHTIHPIAGQGLNLGLRDIDELVKQIVNHSDDIGRFELLNAYQQARLADQKRVVSMTDGLVRVFSNQHIPFVIGRNIGLFAMQFLTLLKRPLARQAMGQISNR